MEKVFNVVLLIAPFIFTYLVREICVLAKRYLNTGDKQWDKVAYSKINWVYTLSIFASTYISSCGARNISKDMLNSAGNGWMVCVLIFFIVNVIIVIGLIKAPYEEDTPPFEG